MKLWSDNLSESIRAEFIEGSYCDKMLKDIQRLKDRPLVDKAKCKGCISAPYDKNYGRCLTCIKHIKFEREKIIRWLRLYDNTIWDSEQEAQGTDTSREKLDCVKLIEE